MAVMFDRFRAVVGDRSSVGPVAKHVVRRATREVRDAYLRRGLGDAKLLREDLALRFLHGDGIEIGAMDYPLRMPRAARVRYVDHLDEAGLREAYAGTLAGGKPLVVPDVVDDGATLSAFAEASCDFIVANHVFEHFEDPIAALESHLRVLRSGGVLLSRCQTLATRSMHRGREPPWSTSSAITATALAARAERITRSAHV